MNRRALAHDAPRHSPCRIHLHSLGAGVRGNPVRPGRLHGVPAHRAAFPDCRNAHILHRPPSRIVAPACADRVDSVRRPVPAPVPRLPAWDAARPRFGDAADPRLPDRAACRPAAWRTAHRAPGCGHDPGCGRVGAGGADSWRGPADIRFDPGACGGVELGGRQPADEAGAGTCQCSPSSSGAA